MCGSKLTISYRYSLAAVAGVMMSLILTAQVTNVNPKIKIQNGKPFYIHTVLSGQTLEQIVDAYYTTTSEISKVNGGASGPLLEGIKLKIPYSAKSLEAMSIANPAPAKEESIVEKSAPAPKQVKKLNAESAENQPTPIEEAAALLLDSNDKPSLQSKADIPPVDNQDSDEELNEKDQKQLQDLTQLSQNISESLANLEEIKRSLVAPKIPKADPKFKNDFPLDVVMPPTIKYASVLLEDHLKAYYDTAKANNYRLHEFFFASFDRELRWKSIEDERTKTNSNTQLIDLKELYGLQIDSMTQAQAKESIGLTTEATRYLYKIKVKRKKIRVYKPQGHVEHLPKDNAHAQIIMKTAKKKGIKGKDEVEIIDGYHEIARYSPFEYNPFGSKEEIIMRESFLRIEKMDF